MHFPHPASYFTTVGFALLSMGNNGSRQPKEDEESEASTAMATPRATTQKIPDEVAPSWQSSMAGGIARSLTYSIKTLGLSGKIFHRMMTKSAFMAIGKRSFHGAPSAPPLKDSHKRVWQQVRQADSSMAWTTWLSGKDAHWTIDFHLLRIRSLTGKSTFLFSS